ncbi:MAG: Glyoxylase, beta-lactamase superfamily [Hydrocarboniphaga sp.]|uniref:MBL fold metallo-hydrolase n=1 Tax=Hydrocarboniphaga sp. TaxID=2033016 RepID=UPI00262FF4EB|nr:MBL fold metallo-hydrolase [Hydrocarboniphaga sp.]MDB5968444.1 Glyoxylase, beta-lactamase superfamily [Hydrocarboniphaga sp.]
MKKLMLVFVMLILLGSALLTWTFTPLKLPVAELADTRLPIATPPADMSLSALPTGSMESSAGFAFRGGDFLEKREFSTTAVLIHHPRGDLLFDAGLGRDVDAHMRTMPLLMRKFSKLTRGTPAAQQLKAQHYDLKQLAGVVLTHAHWDHISGVADLSGVPVWINADEHRFIDSDAPMAALARSFGALPYQEYAFDGGPYLGFAHSFDVWGDGSIVLVPAPGHTPGSIIAFIALPSGARYALLGDLVWQTEGIAIPTERPWLLRQMVDADSAAVRAGIEHVAAIHQCFPQFELLPAHDGRAFAKLPVYPATTQ